MTMKWIPNSSHYLVTKSLYKPELGDQMARCLNMIAGYISIIFNNDSAIYLKKNSYEGKQKNFEDCTMQIIKQLSSLAASLQ